MSGQEIDIFYLMSHEELESCIFRRASVPALAGGSMDLSQGKGSENQEKDKREGILQESETWQSIGSQPDLLSSLIHILPAIVYVSLSFGPYNTHT